MRCPSCQAANAEGRQYCAQCGKPLPACSACGFLNEPEARFCGGCGRPLTAGVAAAAPPEQLSDAAPVEPNPVKEGQRRHVTLMFCDLVGSTALSNALDPEDYREVIRAYQNAATVTVERQGGFIARYMGDGVLVYFGYPRAHEDDAERAVRAALEAVAEVARLQPLPELRLQARVGIATGLAVVGDLIGKGISREEAVVGRAPNLAARLQGLAKPGGVVISEETRAVVANLFTCEDLGTHRLKGFDDPVRAWVVVDEEAVDNRFAATRPSYDRVPLIGRETQCDQLWHAWDEACTGRGQVVMVRGDAGIGKSRLTQALRERARGRPHVELSFHCAPHFSNTALYPITEQLRRDAGIKRNDPAGVALDKLERLLAAGDHDAPIGETLPYLAALLSIPTGDRYPAVSATPERQKQHVLTLLTAKLARLAAQEPVLVLFEDLQWIDPTSLELLQQLIERIADLPVLLLSTARPEFQPPWPSGAGAALIELPHLDRERSITLIESIAGGRPLPDEVQTQILSKSDGVPLFIEEITKAVLESGLLRDVAGRYVLTGPLPGFAVPSSLQDSLMARLDRLGVAKEVAQVGAAIGRQFSVELLGAVSALPERELQPAIDLLVESDLVDCREGADGCYCVFKHALLQDAAHATMLRRKRQQLHRRIAEVLELRAGDGHPAAPEVLAHHFGAASLTEKAVHYLRLAGIQASERAAHTEAIQHFRAAADHLTELPKSPTRNQLELGIRVSLGLSLSAARGYAAPEVEDTYQRARELCHLLGESVDLFPVIRGLCTFYIVRAQLSTARELAEQCVRLGEQSREPVHLIEGYTALGYTLFFIGELDPAEEALQRSLQIYRHNDGQHLQYPTTQDPAISDLSLLALAAWLRGHDALSLERSGDALEIAEELGDPFDQAYAHCFAAMLRNVRNEPKQAAAHAAEAVALSNRYGFDIWLAAGMMQGGIARGALGDETAAELLRQTLQHWQAAGAGLNIPFFLAGLAQVRRRFGAKETAIEALNEAMDHAARHREHFYDATLYRLRGELRTDAGNGQAEPGRDDLEKALAIARAQGARVLELDALASLHAWCVRKGAPDPYLEPLRALHETLSETCGDTAPWRRVSELLDGKPSAG